MRGLMLYRQTGRRCDPAHPVIVQIEEVSTQNGNL
jgi:hypothetical protein